MITFRKGSAVTPMYAGVVILPGLTEWLLAIVTAAAVAFVSVLARGTRRWWPTRRKDKTRLPSPKEEVVEAKEEVAEANGASIAAKTGGKANSREVGITIRFFRKTD
jgi:hypothetical protein